MTLDDLAKRMLSGYARTLAFTTGWDAMSDDNRSRWRDAAQAAADALGVALDPETDPRYEAALKALGASFTKTPADHIACAIVAAIDADKV